MICKNCGHKIIKKIIIKMGEVLEVYKHKKGGKYCKEIRNTSILRWPLNYCYCDNPEPKNNNDKS